MLYAAVKIRDHAIMAVQFKHLIFFHWHSNLFFII